MAVLEIKGDTALVSPIRRRRRTPCTTTPFALMLVTMAGDVKAWPKASTPQTLTGN